MEMNGVEVVLGTYENFVLGFRVVKNVRKDVNPFSLESSFTDDAHRGALRSMAISANGILASSSTDDSVRLHSLRRRKEIGALFEHNGTVNCLSFFERSFMFSASDDGKICMWKTKNWEMLKALKGHKSEVQSVAIHPSGKLALSVGKDKSLLTWDLVTGKLAFQRKISEAAQQILFSSDGDNYILVYQRSIQVCSIQDTKVVKETEMNWRINAICHIEDNVFAVGGDDRHVFLIDVITGAKLLTLDMAKSDSGSPFSGRVRCVSCIQGESGPMVFVGTSNGSIKAFSISLEGDGESSEEMLDYDANVRLTCMAVYNPSQSQIKETQITNGLQAQEKKREFNKKNKWQNEKRQEEEEEGEELEEDEEEVDEGMEEKEEDGVEGEESEEEEEESAEDEEDGLEGEESEEEEEEEEEESEEEEEEEEQESDEEEEESDEEEEEIKPAPAKKRKQDTKAEKEKQKKAKFNGNNSSSRPEMGKKTQKLAPSSPSKKGKKKKGKLKAK